MITWLLLAVGIALIALSAVYVAAEFSLVTVNRVTVDELAQQGDRTAKMLGRGLRHLSTQLSGAQVGITVTTLALGYVMEPSLAQLLTPLAEATGMAAATARTVSVTIALIIATVLAMVFGELVPKNLALARPLGVARRVIGPNTVTTAILRPLITVLNGSANLLLRVVGITPTEELATARSVKELTGLLRRSGRRGGIEQGSARLLAQSLQFSAKAADDIMTPRVDITALPITDTAADVIIAARSGLSRFPVIGEDIDDVRGLVHVKDAIRVPRSERAAVPITRLMMTAPRVPATLPLDDLLQQLRQRGLQMAIVADEYGGTAGLVTLEDAVEELVGEILDEHDVTELGCRIDDEAILIPGGLRPDEVEAETGLALPQPREFDTVAGLLIEELDHLPQSGESITVAGTLDPSSPFAIADLEESDLPTAVSVRLTVTVLDGRRIAWIRATVTVPAGAGAS